LRIGVVNKEHYGPWPSGGKILHAGNHGIA
jgi:hypothetical protein